MRLEASPPRLVLVSGAVVVATATLYLLLLEAELTRVSGISGLSTMFGTASLAAGVALAERTISWKVLVVAAFGYASQCLIGILLWVAMLSLT